MSLNEIDEKGRVYRNFFLGRRKVFDSLEELKLPEKVVAFLKQTKGIDFTTGCVRLHYVSLFFWCWRCLCQRHVIEHDGDNYQIIVNKVCPRCGDAPQKEYSIY